MTGAPVAYWAVKLRGSQSDLGCWERALKSGFDYPYVMRHPRCEDLLLRSADFDLLQTASEVRERGRLLIGDLNGALRATAECDPVDFAGVIKVTGDKIDQWIFGEAGAFSLKMGQLAFGITGGVPQAPKPSPVQKWATVAANDVVVSELLSHFGRGAPNWFGLYKAYECLDKIGKSHKQQLGQFWTEAERFRFKRSANPHRHSKAHSASFEPHPNPMGLEEAESFIKGKIVVVLNILAP